MSTQPLTDVLLSLLHSQGMAVKSTLAAALVRLRERQGLTQSQLSRRAGWERQFVSRLESPQGRMPDFATLVRHGKACGTDIGLLFALPDAHPLMVRAINELRERKGLRKLPS